MAGVPVTPPSRTGGSRFGEEIQTGPDLRRDRIGGAKGLLNKLKADDGSGGYELDQ